MSWVEVALRDGGVNVRDERGLMPLAEARSCLARRRVFAKGESQQIAGKSVLEADRLWAALLSLADAPEFVRVAGRLRWDHPPRGRDNIGPVQRYGEGIIEWLEGQLDPSGRFPPNLWCAAPCLLALGGPRAFRLALRVNRPNLLSEWLGRHPEGWKHLLAAIESGEASAEAALRQVAEEDPGLTEGTIRAHRGPQAEVLLAGLPRLPPSVLGVLEGLSPIPMPPASRPLGLGTVAAGLRNFDYPMWDNMNYATGWMRATGIVSPDSDVLVFQALVTGLGMNNIRRETWWMGVGVGSPPGPVELVREEELFADHSELDQQSLEFLPTGVRRLGRDRYQDPPGGPRSSAKINCLEPAIVVGINTKGIAPAAWPVLHRASPILAFLARLGQDHASSLLLPAPTLAAQISPQAQVLFEFDGFQLPLAGEPVRAAPDLMAMVEALRRRLPLVRLPLGGHPLGGLYDRLAEPRLDWGDPGFWGSARPG